MKKVVAFALCFAFVLLITGCSSIKHPYVQEYVVGQGNINGNVDIEDFYERDKRFEIGATKDGYAVFKNPDEAWNALIENYADGLNLIQNENNLEPISKDNYKMYLVLGAQNESGAEEEREQAHFVSRFLDIYENSFE